MTFMNKKNLIALLLLLIVLGINVTVRHDVIMNETLVADDFMFLPAALNNTCRINKRGVIAKTFLCHVVGSHSIFYGRLIFIVYMSLISVLLFNSLNSANIQWQIAFLCSMSIFAGIPVLSQTTFLTGSYPLHGLLLTLLAIRFALIKLAYKKISSSGYLRFMGLFLLLLFAGVATASNALASLILLPFVVYSFLRKDGLRTILAWLFVSLGPAITLIFLQFSGLFSNHYGKKLGWIEFGIDRIMSQAFRHQSALDDRLGTIGFFTIAIGLLVSIIFYLYHNFKMLRQRNIVGNSTVTDINLNRPIILMGVFITGFFVSTIPSLTVSGSPARYTVIPLFFLFSLLFVIFDQIIKRSRQSYLKFALLTLALMVASYSSFRLYHVHTSSFQPRSHEQKLVRDFLANKSEMLAENAQILIFTDSKSMKFTSGFNHWSTNFTRLATNRQDITAVIGQQRWMIDNPFTGEYMNHDPKYWGIRKGRAYRKKMVGLDKLRPTYIFEFLDTEFRQLNCITLNSGDEVTLYNADKSGSQVIWQGNVTDLKNEILLKNETCATFTMKK